MKIKMKRFCRGLLLIGCFLFAGCGTKTNEEPIPLERPFEERETEMISFSNVQLIYLGDDIGEMLSDGWLLKFYTEMEIDEVGNPIGPGQLMQLMLNTFYEPTQEPSLSRLEGVYVAQRNSGDFNPFTFVDGYMDYLDLPTGRVERPDATFYAEVKSGSTELVSDLLDDGAVEIRLQEDGTFLIEGVLVGKQCRKRRFRWQGPLEPLSWVEPTTPNSTLVSDLTLTTFNHGYLQDRGDYFGLRDDSVRSLLLFLGSEGIDFSTGRPTGSGDLLRLELLVPWSWDKQEGIPAGEYPLLMRNADTSIDRDQLTPYHAVPGLPDCFTYFKWSGAWYVAWNEDDWGEEYARLDRGSVVVERNEEGAHHIRCSMEDCAKPAHRLEVDLWLDKDQLTIFNPNK